MRKKINKLLLITTCVLSAQAFILTGSTRSVFASSAENYQSRPEKKQPGTVKAYYFHGNYRCTNCKKIEQFSREAADKYFAIQLKDGSLTYQVINTDQPDNKHFIQDYQLYTKSLVIVLMQDGQQVKWKTLEKVWQHLNNKDAFLSYVKSEMEEYLKEL